MQYSCPFCFSSKYVNSYLPPTNFNNKIFSYYKCVDCNLHYVSPMPNADDFNAMYPPSYQMGVNHEIGENLYKKISGIRFSYGKQFDLIRQYAPGKKILDYGCGNGNFIINANNAGFDCDGAEYNEQHVSILKEGIPNSTFYLLEEFHKDETICYDVIRLSNVLEHLTNPREITAMLVKKLNPNGILLIEGPVENNFTFALGFRKAYFNLKRGIKKSWTASHVPTHIFFSTGKNQRDFFRNYPLSEAYFELAESEWPFPEKWSQVKGIGSFAMIVIAKCSVFLKALSKNWGNTFIYVGKKHN